MKEFNWEEVEYPCFGINLDKTEIICFSSLKIGHRIADGYYSDSWNMDNFKPYTPSKFKTKLWYWEFKLSNGTWKHSYFRYSDAYAKEHFEEYRKLEALGYIEED